MALKKQGKYRFQDFEVDLARRRLQRDGRTVTIGSRTFDLLTYFLHNPEQVVAKADLMAALWPDADVEESKLGQHIFLLRRALTGSQPGDKVIVTVPVRGYRFTPEVTEIFAPAARTRSSEPQRLTLRSADPLPTVSDEEALEPGQFHDREPGLAHSGQEDEERPRGGPLLQFFADLSHPGPWQVLAITAAVTIAGFGTLFSWRAAHRSRPQSLSMVIADFDNTTGDPNLDFSLKTAASMDLLQSPFLAIASRVTVDQALSEMKSPPGKPLTPVLARQVCSRIHSQAYLTGSVRRLPHKYMVTLQASGCADGRILGASRGIADTPEAVLEVLDRIAADLRSQLGESAASIARFNKPLFPGRTPSLEAFKAFTDAEILTLAGKQDDATLLLQRAVELDSQFVLAIEDLGIAYVNRGDHELARSSLTRAYELRDTVPEPSRLFIVATYNQLVTGDLQASIRNQQAWSDEYPGNPVPLIALADLEIQSGHASQALSFAQRALELNPNNSFAYEVLARAQLRLYQLEQAANTCHLAISRGLDGEQVHAILLQIAFLRTGELDQPEIDDQIQWAQGKPAEPYLLVQQGLIHFALGKAKAGQAALERAAAAYRVQGKPESAARILDNLPRILVELGLADAARVQLNRLPDSETGEDVDAPFGSPADLPVAWAHAGEPSRAEALLKHALESHLTGTLWQQDFAPQIRAAAALNRQQPEPAIQALESAIPYDLRSFDLPSLRGKACLAAKHPDQAETEFHKIVDHPGIEPLSYNYPLARLGIARALAQQGKVSDAENAYNLFFNIWKDADPDLPRLRDAKAEYTRLTGVPQRAIPSANRAFSKPGPSKPASSKPDPSKPRRK